MPSLIRKWQWGFGVLAVAHSAARLSAAQVAAPVEPDPDTGSALGVPNTVDGESERRSTAAKRDRCIGAHRQTQALQSSGQLVQAWEQAQVCMDPGCPGLLVVDCARWLSDLDQRIPSVVFQVRADGNVSSDARVFVGEKRAESWTNGTALRLNPGQHVFRFELPGHPSIISRLVVAEGMRFRVVSAEFATPSDRKSAALPVIVYPLLGVGALGLAGFAGFSLSGMAEQRNLERTCSPRCTDSDLSGTRTRYLVGDISLGLGLAALAGAGIAYWVRPEQESRSSVGFVPLAGGGIATLTMPQF